MPPTLDQLWRRSSVQVGAEIARQLTSRIALLQGLAHWIVDRAAFGLPSLVISAVANERPSDVSKIHTLAAAIEIVQTSILGLHSPIAGRSSQAHSDVGLGGTVLVGDYLTRVRSRQW